MTQSKSQKLALQVSNHPDFQEILAKLCAGVPAKEINEFLSARYSSDSEKAFVLSTRTINIFAEDYLDFYQKLQEDMIKVNEASPEQKLTDVVQGSKSYRDALKNLVDQELDLKAMIRKSFARIELRVEQIYDEIQQDPENFRNDRVLIEYFNTALSYLEKMDKIINQSPDTQININNYSIQVVDQQVDIIINVIREILMNIDYDAYNLFMERYSEEIGKLRSPSTDIIPIEHRISSANKLIDKIDIKE